MIIYPIILSGGSGSRLWPLSTKGSPKQYHSLYGNNSMFQETIIRSMLIPNAAPPTIVCNEIHRFLVKEQLNEINVKKYDILLEQQGKNTALAITTAILHIKKKIENAIVLVLPADHFIEDKNSFSEDVLSAVQYAAADKFVTFGIAPEEINKNYGYIKKGKEIESFFYVEKFIEKPSLSLAEKFLEEGGYLWNSGIFLFSIKRYLSEIRLHKLIFEQAISAINDASNDLNFWRLPDYKNINGNDVSKLSIDYLLLENTKNILVRPLKSLWSDLGTWKSISNLPLINNKINKSEYDSLYSLDSRDCFVSSKKIVATIGVENLVIVDTSDALLIANKDKTDLVSEIQKNTTNDIKLNIEGQRTYRPWGWFEVIYSDSTYKVKKLHIFPKSRLSLQSHKQRAENWTIVSGVAQVTKNDKTFQLNEGESIFIPKGSKHSIENKTQKYIDIIEVQTGSYLEEDDIVRYEDLYGRV